jgi:hypothetical protein
LLVKSDVARKQLDSEAAAQSGTGAAGGTVVDSGGTAVPGSAPGTGITPAGPTEPVKPKRFHGTVELDPARVGRDASRIADEVIAHLGGLVGAKVEVTLEIEAEIPGGAPDQVVRTVTENSRTLKFKSHGFEAE